MGWGVDIMAYYRFLFGSALVFLIALLACGNAAAPAELIVGNWDAEVSGETRSVEFRSDGTVKPEDEELQRYTVIEGEPDIVQIMDLNTDVVFVELELVFDGENKCTLTGGGRTAVLTRVE